MLGVARLAVRKEFEMLYPSKMIRHTVNYRGYMLIWTIDMDSGITSDLSVTPNGEIDWLDWGYDVVDNYGDYNHHVRLYWEL